jgi:hypothetical protein
MPTGIYQRKKGYKLFKNTGDKNPAKRIEVRKKISEAMKGNKNGIGNKSRTGIKSSEETKIKISLANLGKIKYWKGEEATYSSKHHWVRNHKGKPKICENCGKSAKHWANIDHKYHRDLDDYIALCVKCHKKYDRKF